MIPDNIFSRQPGMTDARFRYKFVNINLEMKRVRIKKASLLRSQIQICISKSYARFIVYYNFPLLIKSFLKYSHKTYMLSFNEEKKNFLMFNYKFYFILRSIKAQIVI